MTPVSETTFGPMIAYLVPGATVLFGLSPYSALLRSWFASTPVDAPTLGGFLYLTVASLTVGMTVSAVRWAIVDTIHARTGLPLPPLDFRKLGTNVDAYRLLIEIHYRHYQFYANMFVATGVAFVGYRLGLPHVWTFGWIDIFFIFIECVFLGTSRDTLKKYYVRTGQLFAPGCR